MKILSNQLTANFKTSRMKKIIISNFPVNEIKVNNYGEYVNLKLQDANQFVELISRISKIDPVIVIKADPENIEIEIYNDNRE